MNQFFVIAGLMLFSALKLFFATGASFSAGFGLWESILITSAGGIIGTIVFYFFGEFLVIQFQKWFRRNKERKKPKKTFSKRNKLIVKTKISYGLIGLALITPTLLSIPVGSVVAARFFRQNKRTLPILCLSVVFWSVVLCTLISLGIITIDNG